MIKETVTDKLEKHKQLEEVFAKKKAENEETEKLDAEREKV